MTHRQRDGRGDFDLDSTDELPVLALAQDEDPLAKTGDWPVPAALLESDGDAGPSPGDEATAAFTIALREKSFDVARLERELAATRADLQRLQGAQSAEFASIERRLADVELERLALAAQHDERRAALTAAGETIAAQRAAIELLESRIAGVDAELAAAAFAVRDRDEWRAREAERAAELRLLREELGEARLHVARLLEQLRALEARRRYDADFRAGRAAMAETRDRPSGALPEAEVAVAPATVEAEAPGLAPAPPATAAARPGPARRYLVRLDDPSAPPRVLAGERISVGRTPDNELQLDEVWMSRHHAVLRLGANATVVEDAGSTNGVFVNGRRVRRELLRDGDEVAFGKARFRFQVHRPGGLRD
ncbi:MAG: FHA domain-containing protein [Steroidobacteraceae bacterium]|jgi:hypothetical protein|nr:FHA domain-containing protein [Steroidobacteraceae bacterium]